MPTGARDPEIAKRIAAMNARGPSKVNPDVEKAMRGEKGKRPKNVCPECGEPMDENHTPHDDTTFRAELMDAGRAR